MSPLAELVFTNNNTITYQFNNSEVYQWGSKRIASMTADFGNGVIFTLMQNQLWIQNSFVVNYSTINENKKLIFNIVYTDSTTLTTYAGISIGSDSTVNNNNARIGSTSGLMNHISTIADSNGALGKLEYRVFYGDQNTNNVLKKPFIIVDGFDPADKRRVTKEDCANDPKCLEANKDWGTKTYESISFLMKYNNGNSDLKTQLTALNYDVIIVNFPTYLNNLGQTIDGGADDIFRNGRIVASFLQKINSELQANGSTEKLVIVGPSMGGQITRYALAYMEKKQQETGLAKWNHNTRIYLSMDSPHQGANIPLAIQGDLYFLGELMEQDEAKDKYRNVINSKAARQMLLTNIGGTSPSFINTEYNTYKQELINSGIAGSGGYPVLNGIRKLAISNGSMSGLHNVNPSTKFYEVVALAKLRTHLTLGIRIAKIPAFRINNWFTGTTGQNSILLQNYSRRDNVDFTQNHTNILWQGSLDAVPGGSFNAANDLKDEVYNSLKETNAFTSAYGLFPLLWTGQKLIVEQRIPNNIDIVITPQSFIPTHSALDTSGFTDWCQPIAKNLVCTGQTPFDSFYGENTNMGHITFTDNMVNWLLKELGSSTNPPIPQAPSFPVGSAELSGIDKMCIGETSAYSFTDICKIPSGVTWSVSSNLQIISFTNTSVIVNGLYDGQGVLTATFQNGQTVTLRIWVGVANTSYTLINNTKCEFQYKPIYSDPTATYFWEYISGTGGASNVYEMNINQYDNNLFFNCYESFTVQFKLTVTNDCGSVVRYVTDSHTIDPGPPYCALQRSANPNDSQTIFNIYPNPSKDIVNIELTDKTNILNTKSVITGELFDISGQSRRKVHIKNNTASILVSGLPKGIYVLNINIDGKEEGHQIIVE